MGDPISLALLAASVGSMVTTGIGQYMEGQAVKSQETFNAKTAVRNAAQEKMDAQTRQAVEKANRAEAGRQATEALRDQRRVSRRRQAKDINQLVRQGMGMDSVSVEDALFAAGVEEELEVRKIYTELGAMSRASSFRSRGFNRDERMAIPLGRSQAAMHLAAGKNAEIGAGLQVAGTVLKGGSRVFGQYLQLTGG